VHGMHAVTSKAENSAQGSSCQLKSLSMAQALSY
jgi:hypothetical protein